MIYVNHSLLFLRLFLGLIFLICSQYSSASSFNSGQGDSNRDLYIIGISSLYQIDDSEQDTLIHFQAGIERFFTPVFSTILTASMIVNHEDIYPVLDAGLRLSLDLPLTPFIGMSMFASDNRQREEECRENEKEGCDDPYVIGIYPEIGGHLWMGRRARLSLYGRYYLSNLRGPEYDNRVLGINLGLRY